MEGLLLVLFLVLLALEVWLRPPLAIRGRLFYIGAGLAAFGWVVLSLWTDLEKLLSKREFGVALATALKWRADDGSLMLMGGFCFIGLLSILWGLAGPSHREREEE